MNREGARCFYFCPEPDEGPNTRVSASQPAPGFSRGEESEGGERAVAVRSVRAAWEHVFVKLGYRYRLYPTPEQAEALLGAMGQCRWVWNQALGLRERTWRAQKHGVSYGTLSRYLTLARGEIPWLVAGSQDCQQQALRELCAAYGRAFKARRNGARNIGLPGFRSVKRSNWRTVRFTRNAHRIDEDGALVVTGVDGGIRVRWSRGLPSLPKSATITQDASGRWHASFAVEVNETRLPIARRVVGIDLGVACAYACSDGRIEPNPRHFRQRQRALARSQRSLARKQRGSANRAKAKLRVARRHAQVADARRDWQHQRTTTLVRSHDVTCVETLAVKNLTASAKGTVEQPGRNVRQKAGLNRAILDVGWGAIVEMLDYKTVLYGRELVKIDRFHPSSKQCSGCGHAKAKLALSERTYRCNACGLVLDRDVNAARNILAAGLADKQNACGGRARPVAPKGRGQHPPKQERSPVTAGIPRV